MAEKTIPFPEYAPDVTDLGTGLSMLISGAVPRADGYGPFRSLEAMTNALPADCRGAAMARRSDGSIAIFAGTSTRLYLLNNTTFVWEDVSKGGAAYGPLIVGALWKFRQFNDLVVAVQINTVPQKYTLSSGGAFADLGGSPPQAGDIAVINRFLMLTDLLSNPRRVQWSDLDAPEVWTAGTGLADYQDLPDGGGARVISGGDLMGYIFQDDSIRSMVFAPGSAVTFQINRVALSDPLFGPYSVVEAGDRTFACTAQGFKMFRAGGGEATPIGKERIDRTFFDDVDLGNLQLFQGAVDPQATRVYWAYKSKAGTLGQFDKVLCYDWSIGHISRRSALPFAGQIILALARPGKTLEQLDAVAPGALQVTGAANNGSGLIRLTLNALSTPQFNIVGQNFIVVQGVTGTVEANGQWQVTVVDATHIDLIGSAFVNAYVSGGAIGGSLDALDFSLDSISKAAISSLAAISDARQAAFLTGPNIEAVLETSEQDLEGRLVFISGVRPITDAGAGLISLGGRLLPQSDVSYTDESAIGAYDGICPQILETRYAKARLRIPAGATWKYARGVQPVVDLAGDR